MFLVVISVALPQAASAQLDDYAINDLIKTTYDPEFPANGVTSLIDNGYMVGYTIQSASKISPFFVFDGEVTRVKTGDYGAVFEDVNASGTIVGTVLTESGLTGLRTGYAAMWQAPDYEAIPLEIPPGPNGETAISSDAKAINDDGIIAVQASYGEVGSLYPVVYRPDTAAWTVYASPIGGVPYCTVVAVTPMGRVGAQCWTPIRGGYFPATWDEFGNPWIETLPPGVGSGEMHNVIDNPDGAGWTVIGLALDDPYFPTTRNPSMWSGGAYTQLPLPADLQFCSADAGAWVDGLLEIVGSCADDIATIKILDHHGVKWSDGSVSFGGGEIALVDSLALNRFTDINSAGQIAGVGDRDGTLRSFVLTPN